MPQNLWVRSTRGIGEKSILMGCTFLGGDNFLSSLALEIICLALRQVLSPTHTMTHFGENWGGEEGSVSGGITQMLTGPPWRGVRFCEIVDLVDCICPPPPSKPPVWLSCSVQNTVLKASFLHCRRAQRPAQRARFVWVLSLTTRTTPHLNVMDATYAVITMPTSCQLWCGEPFVLWRDATVSCWSVSVYNKSPPQRSQQSKRFSSSQRSFD